MTAYLHGTNGVIFPDSTTLASRNDLFAYRNKIINGDMRIDQRNAGAAVTHSGASNAYGMDRMVFNSTGTPQFSVQQVADAPAGFKYSAKITTTTSGTPAAGDFSYFGQYIEGQNIIDLQFGTVTAQTVTLSFWIKSSLTGTFGGALKNGVPNRAYPFSFTISSANTWQKVTVTIAGDTTGTWATDNTVGMSVVIDTGSGATHKSTAGVWGATTAIGVTGGVNLVATAAATMNITGVQLELGSVATPFEQRPIGMELALCQRYYEVIDYHIVSMNAITGNDCYAFAPFKVTKRITPTTVAASDISNAGFPGGAPALLAQINGIRASKTANGNFPNGFYAFSATASSEL